MTDKTDRLSLPARIRKNVSRVVIGKNAVVDLAMTALFADGHVLIEDVPGLGKTLLAKALARSISGEFHRVQFTPDLLPSDITGVAIYNEKDRTFEFRRGPVFCNILLGDELNRATPRTQSALLEAMEERQVSADGVTHALPNPFFVMATQNPVEQQGVYTLPEAQLDRFLMQIRIGYPAAEDEARIIRGQLGQRPFDRLEPVADAAEVAEARSKVGRIHVDETLIEYAVRLVDATRRHRDLVLGASPRASLALVTAAQALAYVRGGEYVGPEHLKELAAPVMRHRLILRPQSVLGGRTADQIIGEVLEETPLPITLGDLER